ncbi:phage tail protein I [Halodesulfovibrio aestuarii]|uniref:phage tail protein I n=1 Tax=Halodesulfovibrio aestuarii TaxID=126333 RepID=UPI003D3591D9
MSSLLPANATKYERALEKTCVRSFSLPVLIDRIRNPYTCHMSVLPWLAYERSVDEWNEGWSEEQKRQVTARSISVHKKKGTRGAVEEALGALGIGVCAIEWWEMEPQGVRGTYDLEVQLPAGYKADEATFQEVERVVNAAKTRRSHLGIISLTPADLTQQPIVSGVVFCGETVTIYELGRIKAN